MTEVNDRSALEPLFSSAEMRAVEEAYPGYPDSMRELMVRAGTAVAEVALRRFSDARTFTVVCGGGSNGGDGLVAADALRSSGREVRVIEVKSGERELGNPDVIVDALFGTGFSGAPRDGVAALIEQMNATAVPVVSVDIASGVDASTGEIAGPAVNAAVTVTFYARKVGHVVAPGRFRCGELEIVDIGLAGGETVCRLARPGVLSLLPRRKESGNKFMSGSVLVVGGSPGLSGAVCLVGEAAFRADAGYVTVVIPRSLLPPLELNLIEAVKRPAPEDENGRLTTAALPLVAELEPRAQALAVGPGIGRSEGTRAFVRDLLERTTLPAVVDADALFGLEPGKWASPLVLTPHSGELARLLGKDSAWVDEHRLAAARECAERFAAVTLLKGADTIVASPSGAAIVCEEGTPVLATAGSGDVLTGVIAAFLAKGLEPHLAAAAGAVVHGRASQLIEPQVGVVAGDVVRMLPAAISRDR